MSVCARYEGTDLFQRDRRETATLRGQGKKGLGSANIVRTGGAGYLTEVKTSRKWTAGVQCERDKALVVVTQGTGHSAHSPLEKKLDWFAGDHDR